MDKLTFAQLREANVLRLPLFRNRRGQIADSRNWTASQWLQALVGELGEYANLRKKYERGDMGTDEFQKEAADELADVQIYLDLLAWCLHINLGDATISKFNRVSERVGCKVQISDIGVSS